MEQFQNIVDVLKHSGGSIEDNPGILEALADSWNLDITVLSATNLANLQKEAHEQYLAVAFLLSADCGRYGRLIKDLENNFLQGQDRYPKTVMLEAFSLCTNWKQKQRWSIVSQYRRPRRPRPRQRSTQSDLRHQW
jgi:hypothetical protein